MNALLSLSAFGVVLILVGAVLDWVFGHGVVAGMFGIWGITAIATAVLVYAALRLNRSYERRSALEVKG